MMTSANGLDLYRILQVDPRAERRVIQAAYHALARGVHPDHSQQENAAPAMAMLNRAYGVLRDPGQRQAYDKTRSPAGAPTAASVTAAPPSASVSERFRASTGAPNTPSTAVTFGRYQGWTLQQIVRHDPEYLEWMRRHSSGISYRRQIDEILVARRAAIPVGAPAKRRR